MGKRSDLMSIRLDESLKKQKTLAEAMGEVIEANTLPLIGITVFDFPTHKAPDGEITYPINVAIACENLRDKHYLRGGFTIDELLKIEQNGRAH